MNNFDFDTSDFDFTVGKTNTPIVSLSHSALIFNEHCIFALDYPEFVSIGFDRESKKMAVRKSEMGENPCFRFVTNESKRKRVYLSSFKLRYEIVKLIETRPNYRKPLQFFAEFDNQNEMLIVDLSKPL